MLEYVFFTKDPCTKFITFLKDLGISYNATERDEVQLVEIPEGLNDVLISKIEAFYDDMMEYSSKILSSQTEDGQKNTVGITVTLSDGRISYAVIDPAIVNKVLSVLELEELNSLVCAIADAVEYPDKTPLCQRVIE